MSWSDGDLKYWYLGIAEWYSGIHNYEEMNDSGFRGGFRKRGSWVKPIPDTDPDIRRGFWHSAQRPVIVLIRRPS